MLYHFAAKFYKLLLAIVASLMRTETIKILISADCH